MDDKVFAVPESILEHPLAVSTHHFFEDILDPHNQKMIPGGGNSTDMWEDKSHELAICPDIPPDRDIGKKPPD